MSGKPDNPAGRTKPTQTDPKEWSEETNRRAARKSVDQAGDGIEEELEEGLEDSFPASDPATATRPGATQEDADEDGGGKSGA